MYPQFISYRSFNNRDMRRPPWGWGGGFGVPFIGGLLGGLVLSSLVGGSYGYGYGYGNPYSYYGYPYIY